MVYDILGFLNNQFRRSLRKIEFKISSSLYKSEDRELLKMLLSKDYTSARKLVLSSNNAIASNEEVVLEITNKKDSPF